MQIAVRMGMAIYKILTREEWDAARAGDAFAGAPVDIADGFIHFSTAAQVRETARRYFAGMDGLVLARVDSASLGDALKWEPSRGGQDFPHLYAPLSLDSIEAIFDLPTGPDGGHEFPAEIPE